MSSWMPTDEDLVKMADEFASSQTSAKEASNSSSECQSSGCVCGLVVLVSLIVWFFGAI